MRGTIFTLLLAKLKDVNHIVKMYMPDVNDRNVQDNLIIAINTKSEKYKLTYKGRCEEDLLQKFYFEPVT